MSTISKCTLDTADSKMSILNIQKFENLVVNLSKHFNTLIVNNDVNNDISIVESNTTS